MGLGRLDIHGGAFGSGEFVRVKGLSKIALRTGIKRGLFIALCNCAGAEENRKFLSRDRINRQSSIPLILGVQLSG